MLSIVVESLGEATVRKRQLSHLTLPAPHENFGVGVTKFILSI